MNNNNQINNFKKKKELKFGHFSYEQFHVTRLWCWEKNVYTKISNDNIKFCRKIKIFIGFVFTWK